ncbi:MAG: hypothetical protein V4519_02930 [Patescibacteria group bacterium]
MNMFFISRGGSVTYKVDNKATLTFDGVVEAERCREKLGYPTFDLVASSPSADSKETAMIIAHNHDQSKIVIVPDMSFENPALQRIMEFHGLKDLPTGRTEKERTVLTSFAAVAMSGLADAIRGNVTPEMEGDILVVGEGVLLKHMLAFLFSSTEILPIELGNTHGFRITLDNLRRPTGFSLIND